MEGFAISAVICLLTYCFAWLWVKASAKQAATESELNDAQETIKSVRKGNDAVSDSSYDGELLDKYSK
jgi:preprotein translocase subunit SecY